MLREADLGGIVEDRTPLGVKNAELVLRMEYKATPAEKMGL